MSDLWPFPSSSAPPVIQQAPYMSSPPPLCSPVSPGYHGNSLHTKVPSYHLLPQTQVSPHLSEPQVTSPHHFPPPQVTPLHLPHPQITPPPAISEPQVSTPHLLYQPQETPPHFTPWSQVTPPHLPHTYVTSPHPVPEAQVTSPHLFSPPQCHFSHQNHDPALQNPDWSGAEPPSELPHLPRSCRYSHQNQTSAHLDLQNQSQFPHHRSPYDGQSLAYEHGDGPGLVQDPWRSLGPTLSQLQSSTLGSMSGWSSMEFSSSPAADSSSTRFFYDGCHDNSNAPQPFCSPNTPGPSPHYPQTPQTIPSPGPQTLPREDRHDVRQVSLLEHDGVQVSSEHLQHTGQHLLLQSRRDLIQDQGGLLDNMDCFSPPGRSQDVCSSVPGTGDPAGPSWRGEAGAGGAAGGGGAGGAGTAAGAGEALGGAGGRRRGGKGHVDLTWVKLPQTKNSTEAQNCRLLCTVCKRDFRSLPALNGHMRSHISSRSVAWSNKSEVPPSVSMLMPVTVPVQSRGAAKVCRSRQTRCIRLAPPCRGAGLYRSLLRQQEEEAVAKGDTADEEAAAVSGGGVVTGGNRVSVGYYTPPPMLYPLRAGPGLYCSITTRRQQSVEMVQLNNALKGFSDLVAMETDSPGTLTTGVSKPRINVGRGFQAEIPTLLSRKHVRSNSHNALLLWTPCDELEHPVNQQRVEALMLMARSSVVPRGGASPESTLHVLSECRGDFLLTVDKLLSTPETSNNNNDTAQETSVENSAHGVGWSAAERKLLLRSLQLHHKDFTRIQKTVQTKSLHQCVEFYYLWKKKMSLSARTPAGLTVTLPDTNGQRSSPIT